MSILNEKVNESIKLINDNISDNDKLALSFSGGKDSTIVYNILKSMGIVDKVDIYYRQSGMETDNMKDFLNKIPNLKYSGVNIVDEIKNKKYLPLTTSVIRTLQYKGIDLTDLHIFCCKARNKVQFDIFKNYNIIFKGIRLTDYDKMHRYIPVPVPVTETEYKYKIVNPLINWKSEDCWNYIKENNIELCSDYETIGKTRTCLLCNTVSVTTNLAIREKLKNNYTELYNKYLELAKYCYDNNEELQKIFSSYEEYFELWINKDKMLERLLKYYKK